MIVTGREAGEIAAQGERADIRATDVSTLGDLGVEKNLAADAVAFARTLNVKRRNLSKGTNRCCGRSGRRCQN